MGSSKFVHAIYNDDDVLLSAVKMVKGEKFHIEEIYTPFPVHGLDKAMGLEPTRIAIASFIYGLYWIYCCYLDDELYNDRRLAYGYWW